MHKTGNIKYVCDVQQSQSIIHRFDLVTTTTEQLRILSNLKACESSRMAYISVGLCEYHSYVSEHILTIFIDSIRAHQLLEVRMFVPLGQSTNSFSCVKILKLIYEATYRITKINRFSMQLTMLKSKINM